MAPAETTDPFAVRRLAKAPVFAAVVVGIALAIVANFVVFPSDWLGALLRAGGGLLSGTLVANIGLLAIVVGGCLVAWGRARPADLGLRAADVGGACLITLAVWLLLNAAVVVVVLASGQPLAWSKALEHSGRGLLGELLGQLFGNALYEEILFRGCLLVQFASWLTPRTQRPQRRAVLLALVLSQGVFALQHIPNRLAFDAWHDAAAVAGDLAMLFVAGVFFAGVFLRTGNLLVAVGVHALGNVPALLCAGPDWVHPAAMFAVMLLLLAFGPRLRRCLACGDRPPPTA